MSVNLQKHFQDHTKATYYLVNNNNNNDYINLGKKDHDDRRTFSWLISAQQSFLSRAQYSSPHFNSSLILQINQKLKQNISNQTSRVCLEWREMDEERGRQPKYTKNQHTPATFHSPLLCSLPITLHPNIRETFFICLNKIVQQESKCTSLSKYQDTQVGPQVV